MKKKPTLLLLSSLLLSGCTFPFLQDKDGSTPIDEEETSVSPHDWVDERDYSYNNRITRPSDVVSNIEELEAIVDYHAFYKHEHFSVTPENYQYSLRNKQDLAHELNYLYWHSELVNGVMGMDAVENDGKWDFTFVFYDNVSKTTSNAVSKANDVFYNAPKASRKKTVFATDDRNRKTADVATSQQLFYAVEHSYKVNPIKDSPAERIYLEAKTYLNGILSDGMDEFETFSTIYNDISHTAVYDYGALDYDGSSNPNLYPDEECSQYDCYYLEGFFDHRKVVCDGYSKVLTLLSAMEGIEIVRASGVSDTQYNSRALAGHAYTFLNIEDQWYLSDITWGNNKLGTREVQDLEYMLTAHHNIDPYSSVEWPDIQEVMKQYLPSDDADPYGYKERYMANDYVEYKGKTISRVITSENMVDFVNYVNSSSFTSKGASFADVLVKGNEAFLYVLRNIDRNYIAPAYDSAYTSGEFVIYSW